MRTKIRNAYILIYEREAFIDMEKFDEVQDKPELNTKPVEME